MSCGICSECLQCVYACQKHCIDHDMREELIELNVGSVLLVPWAETMCGDVRPEFGYGRAANVVTSIELERMLSASGPWGGEVRRPSDGEHPRKVAFIQCVGSRDIACDQGYCSSVCCMYATKEAVIAKEHDPNVEPTIFYMDVRSFGKGFERYIERAEQEQGVRYVRSMVSMVTEVPGTGNLRLRYATPDGKNVDEEFDLVVLCEVVEHLPMPLHTVLEKVKAWMAPGGWLFLTTPNLYRLRNVVRLAFGKHVFSFFFYPERGHGIGHPFEYYIDHLVWHIEKAGFESVHTELAQLITTGSTPLTKLGRFCATPLLHLRPLWRDCIVAWAKKTE